ncbi:hypothetical protein FEM48_Zijuj04G0193500 [Ziziphus jujuba var. spinosa]|uniref:RPA-interacting protein central domain-containing protein n=1 Tax=Ziziphus jujuba var. spinosa TaxID=714518 RepID=A0A978VLQ2_ZIZJJ|nr:hypothetical protein FEM48_Zijuj04G0193500 [Ziziphus jujuba var. spinosa]
MIKSACRNIVSDELKKLDSPLNDSLKMSTFDSDINDILWEYDGLHDAYKGECEEILLEMQRIFYEDLRAESTKTREFILLAEPDNMETWQDEEDEYLVHTVYEHMQLDDSRYNNKIIYVITHSRKLIRKSDRNERHVIQLGKLALQTSPWSIRDLSQKMEELHGILDNYAKGLHLHECRDLVDCLREKELVFSLFEVYKEEKSS